jgi:Fur family ferric uptake transcriptional regulator
MSPCQSLIAELRARGHRLTPQREMILQAVAHAGRHVTAEEIFERVQEKTRAVNIATVYRTLDLLVELGMASRADLGDGKVSYSSELHGQHIHLVCRRCGRVIEAGHELVAPLEAKLAEEHGFEADLGHFAIPGLCSKCRSEER